MHLSTLPETRSTTLLDYIVEMDSISLFLCPLKMPYSLRKSSFRSKRLKQITETRAEKMKLQMGNSLETERNREEVSMTDET